ncbi:MAG TPA: hypothetical protein VJN92_17635 [Candidatus Acidoferrum sp.]|nr:hypothetical protein [Candidatus Acidoferrum sp.]
MMVKTYRKGLRFVLVLAFLPLTATNLWSKAPGSRGGEAQESARVTISVYNDVEVPMDVLSRAEERAGQVFRHAGIEVTWLNCRVPAVNEEASRVCREAVFPEHLHLRIVRKSLGLKGETMGISFQAEDGIGCYADLFYEPMEQFHKSDPTDIASLLGYVAAHEIGHLLLGSNSHSAAGIMLAHWTAEELARAKVGALVFSEQESQRMKSRLAIALQARQVL